MGDALPRVGDRIAGDKYQVVRVLGQGGMGVVYEVLHRRLGQRFAIKVLHPCYASDPALLARFDLEARVASRLESPHIARVLDIDRDGEAQGASYLVMELLTGCDLETELRRRGRLSIEEAVEVVTQAATGMREAHRHRVVHRDLKPANLFLCDGEDGRVVRVLDFGLSRVLHEGRHHGRLTGEFSILGTPLYMSPEHLRSSSEVDARSDVWSLGVILFELVTGRPAFTGAATTDILQAITSATPPPLSALGVVAPQALEAVIVRALQKNPQDRFQSMDELIDALRRVRQDPDEPGAPASTASVVVDVDPLPGNRRSLLPAVIAACAAFMCSTGLVVGAPHAPSVPEATPAVAAVVVPPPKVDSPPPPIASSPPPVLEPATPASAVPLVHAPHRGRARRTSGATPTPGAAVVPSAIAPDPSVLPPARERKVDKSDVF